VDILERGSEIPRKFRTVVLEKDGEGHLDQLREKLRSIAKSQGGNECPTYDQEANSIGHIVFRNCLLKYVIEGQMEEAGRRGRLYKQLLYYLK
jgi:hypothetical protein